MSKELVNKGISIIGAHDERKIPVVVVGAARGGTSMVAGALAKLGVFMGDQASPPVFEDVRLSEKFESKDYIEAGNIVSEYSSNHECWGWKRPSSIDYLSDVERVFERVRYVFIYKDVFSISQRNAISMRSEILPGMQRALNQYAGTLVFLSETSAPAMLLSYDKVLADPVNFVNSLVAFCRLIPSANQIKSAVDFVRPDPQDYLEASRITKAQGWVDKISNRSIYGWARYVHSEAPAVVEFFLNDVSIGKIIADMPRADLLTKFKKPCAFVYEITDALDFKRGDVVRARVLHEVRDLNNSPLIIE
ncbi:hypothetical protein [Pseudomonas paeninsulae]|uniref:hypothetical protein n=1 Tax=Pseudomonas paeninsulae TaxID=3110772 RepID=UPI002D79BB70|nr:hypothetical protein [Pseudomonas sp. IT1137]